jgi:AbrB family looped-hinge helix DNA binding protein
MTNTPIIVTITKNGQISIPKKMRRALSLNDGQTVALRATRRGILIETAKTISVRARAEALVRDAKLTVAREGLPDSEAEAWAKYDEAATALRKALRVERSTKDKR